MLAIYAATRFGDANSKENDINRMLVIVHDQGNHLLAVPHLSLHAVA
jgi:hypothetical protein